MATLADAIERYIQELFRQSSQDFVEIRRAELATRFSCVPSQISYVLETRFTPERGFVVVSRRGGGGYVRILRVTSPVASRLALVRQLLDQAGARLSARQADAIISRLVEAGLLSVRAAAVWRATLRRQAQWVPEEVRDQVRAALMRAALTMALVQWLDDEDGDGEGDEEAP